MAESLFNTNLFEISLFRTYIERTVGIGVWLALKVKWD